MANNFLKFLKTSSRGFVTRFKTFEPTLVKTDAYPKAWYIVDGQDKLQLNHDETFQLINQKLEKMFKNEEVAKKDWLKIPKNKLVKIVLTNGVTLFGTLNHLSDVEVTETRYNNLTGFLQTLSKRLDTNNLEFYKKVFTVSVPANNKIYLYDEASNTFKNHLKFINNGLNKLVSSDDTDVHLFITSDNEKPKEPAFENVMEIFEYNESIYIDKIYQ